MTVGEMRRLMLKKVVPEKVIPQNISEFLIDEEAELVEPDAFTFLTRLRELGIGSADFIYLLEGCGAPEAAVMKIKSNPAMNLQSLILTLDNSGMTSKDYTRILYTARQIWEHTLTMRLEKTEQLSAEDADDDDSAAEPGSADKRVDIADTEDITDTEEAAETAADAEPDDAAADAVSGDELGGDYDEDIDENYYIPDEEDDEPSFSSVFETVTMAKLTVPDDRTINSTLTCGFKLGETEEFENLLGGGIEDPPEPGEQPSVAEAEPVKAPKAPETRRRAEDKPTVDTSVIPREIELPKAPEVPKPEQTAPAKADDKPGTLTAIFDALEKPEADDSDMSGDFDELLSEKKEDKYDILDDDMKAEAAEKAAEAKTADTQSIEFIDPEDFEKDKSHFTVEIDYDENAKAPKKKNAGAAPQGTYNGETTQIIPIDRGKLEKNLYDIANSAGFSNRDDNDKDDKDGVKKGSTGKQRNAEPKEQRERRSHKPALIAGAAGAAVVVCSGIAAGLMLGAKTAESMTYAVDEIEIFSSIYYAYSDKAPGGDSFYPYPSDSGSLIGDMLVKRASSDGFGTFYDNGCVYTVTTTEISVGKALSEEFETIGRLKPPEKTKFADAAQMKDGALIAAFDGECCGFMRISGGTVTYTVRQDGALTDLGIIGDEVRVGSVYTPKFYENFTISDLDVYLPKLGREYTVLAPQNVIVTGTKGYSYAISAQYSLGNGDTLSASAAIGNPVYASGDGYMAFNGSEAGLLLKTVDIIDEKNNTMKPGVVSAECGRFRNMASFAGGLATLEDGQIVLRGSDMTACAALANLTSEPVSMAFDGSVLVVSDKEKAFLAMDCRDMNDPKQLDLKTAQGRVFESDGEKSAVTLEQTADGLSMKYYYTKDGGLVEDTRVYNKSLTGEQRGTLELGGAETMIAGGGVFGASYSYFDGVSVVSEFVAYRDIPDIVTLYDDRTGIQLAFRRDNGSVSVLCGEGLRSSP